MAKRKPNNFKRLPKDNAIKALELLKLFNTQVDDIKKQAEKIKIEALKRELKQL